jgi:leucyl aminopeptidase
MAGLTVEVDNTDAEGRLTLADAMEFARRKGATHMVDVATLTGAIRIVLGTAGAGIFGNTPEFTQSVAAAAESAGERVWELPMWEELARNNDSKIADIKNSGGDVGAGSINAAHFLARFADKTAWVHMDIASVAFEHEQGTGWGVRTLIELARKFGK